MNKKLGSQGNQPTNTNQSASLLMLATLVVAFIIGGILPFVAHAQPKHDEENNVKVMVCHQEGNGGWHSIEVNDNAVQSHINHGDFVIDGSHPCPPPPAPVLGCMDVGAENYNPYANQDDGSCEYASTLTVVVTGGGSVTTSPAGISCSPDCSFDFEDDSEVTLTATPDIASTFTGWGGACSGTGTCVLEMDSDKEVTASFEVTPTEPEACPEGQIGTPPNCITPPQTCPQNTTGEYPNCLPIAQGECAENQHGTYPDCIENDVTPPTDICANIEGPQSEVPAGKHIENENQCVDNPSAPAPTNNGGNSGNGPIFGSLGPNTGNGNPAVLGASCGPIITSYMRLGKHNDSEQVKVLQSFLNKELGLTLEVSGTFDVATDAAVKQFQAKYSQDVLGPWGISQPTGYVYKTTSRWINMLSCNALNLPIPELN